MSAAAQAQAAAGYQHLMMPDPAGPPVEVSVWYPTNATPHVQRIGLFMAEVSADAPIMPGAHPLVVISHGNGGDDLSHIDTAMALARAGYVAAALTHTGDNPRDQSRALDVANRPRQLKLLIDYMLSDWAGRTAIDPARVGAFGFSSGGFTVLAAAGGEVDLSKVGPYCLAHPTYYSCQLVARFPGATDRLAGARPVWTHDARIKAVVAAAPALGFAFGKSGLAQVTQPIQLWRAADDHILPQPDYAEAVYHDLPARPDYRVVANADHYDFLAPCSDALAKIVPFICVSRPGFDRAAFHADFNRAVVAFFDATLKHQ
jgi:predicted dienelactone hydrolase